MHQENDQFVNNCKPFVYNCKQSVNNYKQLVNNYETHLYAGFNWFKNPDFDFK